MQGLILLIVIATSVWVAYDAQKIGAKPGKLGGGLFDMSPIGWSFACLLLWIVAFPLYLVKREDIKKANLKTCPFCAEKIKKQAKVCRYCGRDLIGEKSNRRDI